MGKTGVGGAASLFLQQAAGIPHWLLQGWTPPCPEAKHDQSHASKLKGVDLCKDL